MILELDQKGRCPPSQVLSNDQDTAARMASPQKGCSSPDECQLYSHCCHKQSLPNYTLLQNLKRVPRRIDRCLQPNMTPTIFPRFQCTRPQGHSAARHSPDCLPLGKDGHRLSLQAISKLDTGSSKNH